MNATENIGIDNMFPSGENIFLKYRKIIIIGFFVLLIVVFLLIVLFARQDDPESPFYTSPTVTPYIPGSITRIPSSALPTYPPTPVPQAGDIIVSGIAVNDFTKNAEGVLSNGDVIIKETETYSIMYYDKFESFMISITGKDFERARAAAERDFLGILGINEANACRLTVTISTPAFVQNGYAGQTFPLSVCVHKVDSD